MDNPSERLRMAQWILERNLSWISAAEVKTGIIVTIDTAMLGAVAVAFSSLPPVDRTTGAGVAAVLAAIPLVAAIFFAALVVLPRVEGPDTSFVFFGKVAKNNEQSADYDVSFRAASTDNFLEDCLAQIHRNAQIASEKFKWVRSSMICTFLAVLPWAVALGMLARR